MAKSVREKIAEFLLISHSAQLTVRFVCHKNEPTPPPACNAS